MSDVEMHLHAKFHTKDAQSLKKPRATCCLCLRAEENLVLLNSQSGAFLCGDCLRKTSTLLSPKAPVAMSPHKMSPNSDSLNGDEVKGRKTYQCIKCQQTFGSEEQIQAHVATHLTEGARLECHLCSTKHFDSPLKLQTHLIEHTFEGCPSFRCYICSTLFTTPNALQKHILSHGHNAAPYDCLHCKLKFFFRAELENHSYSHLAMNGMSEFKQGSQPGLSSSNQSEINHNSNQSESNNSSVSESNNNSNQSEKNIRKRKRKKFFYRSDDSEEEMETDSPIKEERLSPMPLEKEYNQTTKESMEMEEDQLRLAKITSSNGAEQICNP